MALKPLRLLALAALVAAAGAQAQTYPTKPITMIVPFAAGGPTDTVARTIGGAMQKSLGQTVLVENVGGAGGTLGAERVARAAPDGYPILLHHIGMSTAPALYRNLRFKPMEDFVPIGLVADVPMTMIARGNFPPNNFKEFLAYVKANKDKLSYANAGLGSASHLCGLLFMSRIETDFVTVPYKGTAPAMNDLLGGQVDFMCDQTTNTTGQIKGGKVKAYAVTSSTRVPSLPDLPTIAESGIPGFEVVVWHGVYAPKGTPKAVQDKLVAALQDALKDPTVKQRFNDLGTDPVPQSKATPEALAAQLKSEIAKWGPIIQKAGQYAD
ncbi:MAG: tripartite tricarboxylate transporter substrate binding protein BugD [Burkholderiales bacterium]|nr:tripartite tricarboxylate transporter substrate binding protein BugD [Burkholderiales bacterium]